MFLGIVTALIFQSSGTKCFPPENGGVSKYVSLTFNSFQVDTCEPTMKNMKSLAGAIFFMATAQFMGNYMMTTTTF